jgi:hypothetical protein
MATPDPISTAIATKGFKAGLAAAQGLIQKLFGPAAEEIGLMLRDKARVYRVKNLLSVLAKTDKLLREKSVDPHPVPLRTLLPIIEGASIEDDESLSQKWAGLLASAAALPDPSAAHPSFPRILGEITPREAVMLERLFESGGQAEWLAFRKKMATEFGCSEEIISSAHGNLFRLHLWLTIQPSGSTSQVVNLTAFGRLFLAATQGPKSSS